MYDNIIVVVLFMTGEEEKVSNATICGPSSAHQRNAIKCVSLGPILNAGFVAL